VKTNFFILLCFLSVAYSLNAQNEQPPQAFNYQAIARDNIGAVLSNKQIGLRIGILDNSASGSLLYSETFNVTTNQFGLFTISIGMGARVSGLFSNINWAVGTKWLNVETDMAGGNSYTLMGTTQLLSVPYALYSATSGVSNAQHNSVSTFGDTLYLGNSFLIIPGISMANACRMDFADTLSYTRNYPHASDYPYNSFLFGLPKFISKNYIELDRIDSISRYRSGAGHDYSDSYESCRSMKHYFRPKYGTDWSTIKIFSPVNGVVSSSTPETIGGNQVSITPFGMPAFNVTLFHVNLSQPLTIGDTLRSGQQIGTHTGNQTTSDIAIQIAAPNNTYQRVSFFDVMTDKLFSCFMSKGIMTRDALIIPKADRDADPLLPCNGNQFFYQGTINNWVPLH